MTSSAANVTRLLLDWRNGDQHALDALMPLVYDELRTIAKRYMSRERSGHTLQTGALINEAYLRLVDKQDVVWQNRTHFFAIAARIMRNLLVDHARAKQMAKRGGGALQVSLNEALVGGDPEVTVDLLALDQALSRLSEVDERKCRIIELRFFGGLSAEETAEALGLSEITIKREWLKARAWLFRELSGAEAVHGEEE
ncbi:MAG: sigma-70 family RNA polymerase sigma factor [Acidobacteria bacterium]|nr:sigma-70 family RNA polymerase sigma factor [Acidobacteriota bacterium]